MKIIQDVPDIIYRANNKQISFYDKGGSDLSASDITNPVRMFYLKKEYDDQIEKYASDMIDALEGSALHYMIRLGAEGEVVEERFHEEIDGWKVSGQIDCYDPKDKTLYDWKRCNVNEWIFGIKESKFQQINIYKYLMREQHEVEKLKLGLIFSNWERKKAGRDGYPPKKIIVIEAPSWSMSGTKNFICNRLAQFEECRQTGELPYCTDAERWVRPTTYACMKKGRKSAVRVFDSSAEAEEFIKHNPDLALQVRHGGYARCKLYCDVYKYCQQAGEDEYIEGYNKWEADKENV